MKQLRKELVFGEVIVTLVRRGESFPCPSKGHPPFTHERDEPVVVLTRGADVLRVVPASKIKSSTPAVFRGHLRHKPWSLSETEIAQIARWASKPREPVQEPTKAVPSPRRTTTAPKRAYFRRRAKVHPMAARAMLECDYDDKLNPQDRAWLEQFDRETALNRWHDGDVEAFYPRGSEARRKLQFEYNRRADDILNSPEWWPDSIDADVRDTAQVGIRPVHAHGAKRMIHEVMPANTPTEADLVNAIDRSRE